VKVKELRFVQIKERYFDALIRIYDNNVAKYFHYNPETLPYTVLGIMLIFIGNLFINMSFTQNMVSLQLNIPPQIVATNTVLACAISGIVNCFISFRKSDTEVFDLIAGMNGLIVGYVSITSCCHNVESWAALLIGAFGSMLQELFRRILRKLEVDDPMDSISTHGICGLWSLIALGLFDNDKGAIITGDGRILGIQLIGAVSLIAMSVLVSVMFFFPLKKLGKVRLSKIQEIIGMDIYLK
jgi:ammonium transporter, Amt family